MGRIALLFLLVLSISCNRESSLSGILITNVRIVDGTGESVYAGAVRMAGGRIQDIGNLQPLPSDTVIDGHGQVLAPGFIDTHSHHDWGMFEKREMPEVVSQGVTTIVIGQDGGSVYPLSGLWRQLDSLPVAVNVASYTGHNTLRAAVMEDYQHEASIEQIEEMKIRLREELDAGALGLSTGLEYDPGIYASPKEVLDLCGVLGERNRRYISHMRSEDRHLWDAVEEVLNIGRTHQVPVQISHMKIAIVRDWGKADSLLNLLESAREEGIDVTADVYPYEYWQSTMTVLFPERNFRDIEAARYALTELTTPDGMIISAYEPEPALVGRRLSEIAVERGEEPAHTYLSLINTALDQQAEESIICRSMTEADVARLACWPWSNICSDGSLNGRHPRGAGSFTRVLRRYVREENRLPLEELIRQMTSLAARNMGFEERGLIRPGYRADLVLFDPEKVTDRATFDKPGALSTGIEKVWVNGRPVWENGKATGQYPGQAIRAR